MDATVVGGKVSRPPVQPPTRQGQSFASFEASIPNVASLRRRCSVVSSNVVLLQRLIAPLSQGRLSCKVGQKVLQIFGTQENRRKAFHRSLLRHRLDLAHSSGKTKIFCRNFWSWHLLLVKRFVAQ